MWGERVSLLLFVLYGVRGMDVMARVGVAQCATIPFRSTRLCGDSEPPEERPSSSTQKIGETSVIHLTLQ